MIAESPSSQVVVHYQCELPLPPSLNGSRTYTRSMHLTREACSWKDEARLNLARAGVRPLAPLWGRPPQRYAVTIDWNVYCAANRDIDAGIKLGIDEIAATLGIDDKHVKVVRMAKYIVRHRAEYKVVVGVLVERV